MMTYHLPSAQTVIIVFFITALWDVVLRYVAMGSIPLLGIERMRWVTNLKPYFQQHTLLAAALIAGFVGAVTLPLITLTKPSDWNSKVLSLVWVALVSGVVGVLMRYSGLFPYLTKYYYDTVPHWYSFLSDANSGVVVAVTYHVLLRIIES